MNVLEAQGNGALYAPAVNSNYLNFILFVKWLKPALLASKHSKCTILNRMRFIPAEE